MTSHQLGRALASAEERARELERELLEVRQARDQAQSLYEQSAATASATATAVDAASASQLTPGIFATITNSGLVRTGFNDCIQSWMPGKSSGGEWVGLQAMDAAGLRFELGGFSGRISAAARATDSALEEVQTELGALGAQLQEWAQGGEDGSSARRHSAAVDGEGTEEDEKSSAVLAKEAASLKAELRRMSERLSQELSARKEAEEEAARLKRAFTEVEEQARLASNAGREKGRQAVRASRMEAKDAGDLAKQLAGWKEKVAAALRKVEAAGAEVSKLTEERATLAASNKTLTKRCKELDELRKRELAAQAKAHGKESEAMDRYKDARGKSREGREMGHEADRALWEAQAEQEIGRADQARQAAIEDAENLRAALAQVASRAERAETEEARLKGQLERSEIALTKKEGQLQRLVTTCTVLEQKLRALMAESDGGGGGGSLAEVGAASMGSSMTIEGLSGGTGGGGDGADSMRCALCGQFAQFDRSRDPAAVAGFVPSTIIPASVREVTRFGTTPVWSSTKANAPHAKEAAVKAEQQTQELMMATHPDEWEGSFDENGESSVTVSGGGVVGHTGAGGGTSGQNEHAVELGTTWVEGDDGWYFGDVPKDEEGEPMCWCAIVPYSCFVVALCLLSICSSHMLCRMASRRLGPSGFVNKGALQISKNRNSPPARPKSLPPLDVGDGERESIPGETAKGTWQHTQELSLDLENTSERTRKNGGKRRLIDPNGTVGGDLSKRQTEPGNINSSALSNSASIAMSGVLFGLSVDDLGKKVGLPRMHQRVGGPRGRLNVPPHALAQAQAKAAQMR